MSDVGFAPADYYVNIKFSTDCAKASFSSSSWNNDNLCHSHNWLSRRISWLLNASPTANFYCAVIQEVSGYNTYKSFSFDNCANANYYTYPAVFLDSDVRVRTKDDENYGSSSNPFQILMKKY